jgi:hypothetical protein
MFYGLFFACKWAYGHFFLIICFYNCYSLSSITHHHYDHIICHLPFILLCMYFGMKYDEQHHQHSTIHNVCQWLGATIVFICLN